MADILSGIGSVITSVIGWITSVLSDITSLFYTPGSSGGTGTFTFLGVLLLVSFGLGMIWTLINFVRGLVRRG